MRCGVYIEKSGRKDGRDCKCVLFEKWNMFLNNGNKVALPARITPSVRIFFFFKLHRVYCLKVQLVKDLDTISPCIVLGELL